MQHVVIGTAGHIDHGKTMLLKALTGMDADRLPEEKAREMTIDLGFVFLGRDITIIDVPGHEKFIKNMLAGVSTIDLVILVIAADDGIMPQTKEHFEILRLLNIKQGIIAITKIDLVDKEWLELVTEEITEFVKDTFLENAPIMEVSGTTGEGIDRLKEVLLQQIKTVPQKSDKGIFRLWTDRVFMLKGIGTIVAGTVLSGTLKVGDKVELLPQGEKIRVRTIQVHNENVEQCFIGERAAINVIGIEASEIIRGNVLAAPGHFNPTYMINAKLYLLKDVIRPLENRTRIRFHIGSIELLARVIMLDKKPLLPGKSKFVQFRLEELTSVDIGDHFVIRSYSPAHTIGGGIIVEVHTEKLKYLPENELQKLEKLEEATPEELILHNLSNSLLELKVMEKLAQEISLTLDTLEITIEQLKQKDLVTVVGKKTATGIVLTEHILEARKKILTFLTDYHKKFTYLKGIKRSELNTKLFGKIDNFVFDEVLNPLMAENRIKLEKETVSLKDHRIIFTSDKEEIKNKIEDIYLRDKFTTKSVDEIAAQFSKIKKNEILNIMTGMIELGILVEIKTPYYDEPFFYHKKNIEEAKKILIDLLKEKSEIKFFEYREKINSTRKFTTPLLQYFDDTGVTERQGEIRRLKNI